MIAAVKEVSKVSSLVFYKILGLTTMLLLSAVQNYTVSKSRMGLVMSTYQTC